MVGSGNPFIDAINSVPMPSLGNFKAPDFTQNYQPHGVDLSNVPNQFNFSADAFTPSSSAKLPPALAATGPHSRGGGFLGAIAHGIGSVYNDVRGGLRNFVADGAATANSNDPQFHFGQPLEALWHGLRNPGQANQAYDNMLQKNDASISNTPQPKWAKDTESVLFNTLADVGTDPLTYVPFGKVADALGVTKGAKALTDLAKSTSAGKKIANVSDYMFKPIQGARNSFVDAVSRMSGKTQSGANAIKAQLKDIFTGTTPEQRIALTHALESTPVGTKLNDPTLENLRQQIEPLLENARQTALAKGLIPGEINPEEYGVARYIPHVSTGKLDEAAQPFGDITMRKTGIDAGKTRGLEGTIQAINASADKPMFESDMAKILGYHLNQINKASSIRDLINEAMAHGIPIGEEAAKEAAPTATKVASASAAPKPFMSAINDWAGLNGGYEPLRTAVEKQTFGLNAAKPGTFKWASPTQTLRNLYTEAGKNGLPVGREYEGLQDVLSRLSGRKGVGLDELINQSTKETPLSKVIANASQRNADLSRYGMGLRDLFPGVFNQTGTKTVMRAIEDNPNFEMRGGALAVLPQVLRDAVDQTAASSAADNAIKVGDFFPGTSQRAVEYSHGGNTALLPESEANYLKSLSVPKTDAQRAISGAYRGTVNGLNRVMFLSNPFIHILNNLGTQTLMHSPRIFAKMPQYLSEALHGVEPGSKMDEALKSGALHLTSEIGHNTNASKQANQLAKELNGEQISNPLRKSMSAIAKGAKSYNNLTPNIERSYRAAAYETALEDGKTPDEAVRWVRSIYGGNAAHDSASNAEKVATAIMPFFNWTKTAIASNLKNAAMHPARYVAGYHALNDYNQAVTGHDMGQNHNPLSIGLPWSNAQGLQEYYTPYAPPFDVGKLAKDIAANGIRGPLDFAQTRFNPLAKYISQVSTGEQNPFASPLNKFNIDKNTELARYGSKYNSTGMFFGGKGPQLPAYLAQLAQDMPNPGSTVNDGMNASPRDFILSQLLGGSVSAPNPLSTIKEQNYNNRETSSQYKSFLKSLAKQKQGG